MALKERAATGSWWVENLLRPIVIAIMMTCMVAPAARFLRWPDAEWASSLFLAFVFLANMEGILSERLLHKQRITGWAYLGSRAAEWLVLAIILKVVNYLPLGLGQLWADAATWLSDPNKIFSETDFFTILLFTAAWVASLYVAHQAAELDVEEIKVAPPEDKTSTEYYLWLTAPPLIREREEALAWLGESFLWGGVTILILSAAIYLILPETGASVLPVVLYFLLGVALLSQARFSVSHMGWQVQGISVQRGIAQRWLRWAVLFLVAVTALALLLPTDYAMGPILAIYGFLMMIFDVAMLIIAFIVYLLVLLLAFLFPNIETPTPPSLTAVVPTPSPEPTPVSASQPWIQVLMSALFWILILGIVGYALLRFLQDRWGLLGKGQETAGSWWARFRAWLRALWHRWWAWGQEVGGKLIALRADRQARLPLADRVARFFSLRGLAPRELVRYFYLSAERRAARAGQPRQPGQTPYEYRAALDGHFPDLEPDLSGLTDAFVLARYSPKPVEPEDAEAVKPLWQRIKAALRLKRVKYKEEE
jgi:hypothetical protein